MPAQKGGFIPVLLIGRGLQDSPDLPSGGVLSSDGARQGQLSRGWGRLSARARVGSGFPDPEDGFMTGPDNHVARSTKQDRDRLVEEGLALMTRVIGSVAKGRLDDDEVRSLAHECWIEFVRADEREPARNAAKLQSDIAWKRAVNRVTRARPHSFVSIDATSKTDTSTNAPGLDLPDPGPGPESSFDHARDLAFVIQAVLAHSKENCREAFAALLRFDFDRAVAAEALEMRYNSFVVTLNRCLERARAILAVDSGPLGRDWRELRELA